MMKFSFQSKLFVVSLLLASCSHSRADMPPSDSETGDRAGLTRVSGVYLYQKETGRCINAQGQLGFNAFDENSLFENGALRENLDLSCVQMQSVDLTRIFGAGYKTLKGWKLDGADMSRSTLRFIKFESGSFLGTQFTGAVFFYSELNGLVDRFTLLPPNCPAVPGNPEHGTHQSQIYRCKR